MQTDSYLLTGEALISPSIPAGAKRKRGRQAIGAREKGSETRLLILPWLFFGKCR